MLQARSDLQHHYTALVNTVSPEISTNNMYHVIAMKLLLRGYLKASDICSNHTVNSLCWRNSALVAVIQ